MRTDGLAIRDFMAQKRIALVGLSHEEKAFSRAVMRELVARGYDVVPVNPSGGEIEGRQVYAHVRDIDDVVGGAIIMTPSSASAAVVRDCVQAGVPRVWLHQGVGPGSVSEEALCACDEAGISVVAGECPLMYVEDAGFIHRAHCLAKKMVGTWPAEFDAPLPMKATAAVAAPAQAAPVVHGAPSASAVVHGPSLRFAVGLGLLQTVVALGAIPAGISLVNDPSGSGIGLTVDLLARSPFVDFYWPGVFLLAVNGIGTALAGLLSFLRLRPAGETAVVFGGALVVWMVFQVMWTGLLSPLQPFVLWAGLAEAGFGMAFREELARARRGA